MDNNSNLDFQWLGFQDSFIFVSFNTIASILCSKKLISYSGLKFWFFFIICFDTVSNLVSLTRGNVQIVVSLMLVQKTTQLHVKVVEALSGGLKMEMGQNLTKMIQMLSI